MLLWQLCCDDAATDLWKDIPRTREYNSMSTRDRAQIHAAEPIRQQQGHHKTPSVQLYSRDDTLGALELQTQILKDQMTLKSKGLIPLYYEFLYGI